MEQKISPPFFFGYKVKNSHWPMVSRGIEQPIPMFNKPQFLQKASMPLAIW
jgi:hypothetical protein